MKVIEEKVFDNLSNLDNVDSFFYVANELPMPIPSNLSSASQTIQIAWSLEVKNA